MTRNFACYVLNLIINGLPSIPLRHSKLSQFFQEYVLNLIINGLPSIQKLLKKKVRKQKN